MKKAFLALALIIFAVSVLAVAGVGRAQPSRAPTTAPSRLRFVVIGDAACDACVIAEPAVISPN